MRPRGKPPRRRRPHLTAEQVKGKIGEAFSAHLGAYNLPPDIVKKLTEEISQRLARKSRLGNAVLSEQLSLEAILRGRHLEKGGRILVTLLPDGTVRIVRQDRK